MTPLWLAASFAAALLRGFLAPPALHHETPLSRSELHDALRDAHTDVFGHPASPSRLRVAWAHTAIETGQGRLVRGFNLGNVGAGPTGPAYRVAGVRFRVYATLEEGARAYWRLVRERCSGALPSFDAGDAAGAAAALRRCGWFRAPVDRYAAAMVSLANTYERIQ